MNVILIGYRGTGKSTVGQALALRLSRPFVDADELLEARAGCSIAKFFEQRGEAAFRDLESQILAEVLSADNQVVALGGGAVMRVENRTAIRSGGRVFWLQADPTTLLARLQSDPLSATRRPALTAADPASEIRAMLELRQPLYEQSADHAVCTEKKSLDAVVDEIVCFLETPRRNPT